MGYLFVSPFRLLAKAWMLARPLGQNIRFWLLGRMLAPGRSRLPIGRSRLWIGRSRLLFGVLGYGLGVPFNGRSEGDYPRRLSEETIRRRLSEGDYPKETIRGDYPRRLSDIFGA